MTEVQGASGDNSNIVYGLQLLERDDHEFLLRNCIVQVIVLEIWGGGIQCVSLDSKKCFDCRKWLFCSWYYLLPALPAVLPRPVPHMKRHHDGPGHAITVPVQSAGYSVFVTSMLTLTLPRHCT